MIESLTLNVKIEKELSRTMYMISQALAVAKRICPIISILRAIGDEVQIGQDTEMICGLADQIDNIVDSTLHQDN